MEIIMHVRNFFGDERDQIINSKSLTYLKVVDDCRTHETKINDYSYDYQKNHLIQGVTVISSTEYFDIVVNFPIEINTTYYLLVVDYNTGDSYSNSENEFEFVDLFKTKSTAEEMAKIIIDDDNSINNTDLLLACENGEIYQMCRAWCGYNENLNDVKIIPVTVI